MSRLTALMRRRPSERGFTLIELLVVIIILGVLAAVVVFAVNGVGDKGKSNAVKIDARTIRTAQEAFCAKKGRYGIGTELVAEGLLSDLPEYNAVTAAQDGGPCNGWSYSINATTAGGGTAAQERGPGEWTALSNPPHGSFDLTRLASGRVLSIGSYEPTTGYLWSPSTGTWTPVASNGFGENSFPFHQRAVLLRDDLDTPGNQCGNNCNKVLEHTASCGSSFCAPPWNLFDETVPGWEVLPKAPTSPSNGFDIRVAIQLLGGPTKCGTHCGKVLIFSQNGSRAELYNPADNSFVEIPYTAATQAASLATLLPDGRVLMLGYEQTPDVVGSAMVFDPITAGGSFTDVTDPDFFHMPSNGPVVLPSGDILFGSTNSQGPGSPEIYHPVAGGPGTWETVPNCGDSEKSCSLLSSLVDGKVIAMAVGTDDRPPSRFFPSPTSFVFDPATKTWSTSGDIIKPTSAADAVLLDPAEGPCEPYCGKVLIAGYDSEPEGTPSMEYYTP